MLIHILAGGPHEFVPDLHKYNDKEVKWVGVDRGLITLLKAGIMPIKAFGDFDSITRAELEWARETLQEIEIWPSEKDKTDTDLALDWVVRQNPSKIRLFGATGGRLDHLFGNLQLLIKNIKTDIEIIDKQNIVTVHEPGEHTVPFDPAYRYVSFIPISGVVERITLKGFKYPLTNCHIQLGSTLCISNELIHSYGTFSFSEGILMMVRSKDLGVCF